MDFCKVADVSRKRGTAPFCEWKEGYDTTAGGKCVTRKATKAELKAAEADAEKDLWRTYHRHLGEDGKKKRHVVRTWLPSADVEVASCRCQGWQRSDVEG